MILVATVVVVAFGVFLIAFTGVAFAKPAVAERFLMLFARSVRTHYAEQVIRLLVGAALVVLSPDMWQSKMFWLVGWAVVVSSIALMCLPWQWHHRFAERVIPIVIRHLRLCAMGPLAFGALLLYGVFAGGGAA
jgi:protein-S-isoprenylcysteine O-methyltransferase Ste14